jgi:hypothetical protein
MRVAIALGATGIVDSGADVTCLPVMTSALLGLDKEDLEPSRVQQFGGAKAAFQARIVDAPRHDRIAEGQVDGEPQFGVGERCGQLDPYAGVVGVLADRLDRHGCRVEDDAVGH